MAAFMGSVVGTGLRWLTGRQTEEERRSEVAQELNADVARAQAGTKAAAAKAVEAANAVRTTLLADGGVVADPPSSMGEVAEASFRRLAINKADTRMCQAAARPPNAVEEKSMRDTYVAHAERKARCVILAANNVFSEPVARVVGDATANKKGHNVRFSFPSIDVRQPQLEARRKIPRTRHSERDLQSLDEFRWIALKKSREILFWREVNLDKYNF